MEQAEKRHERHQVRKACDGMSGLGPAAAGHAQLLAELSTPLSHCCSELFILAEFSASSELWIMSQRQRGAGKKKEKKKKECSPRLNKVSPATIGHINCDSICGSP